jgi:hypothetical protein
MRYALPQIRIRERKSVWINGVAFRVDTRPPQVLQAALGRRGPSPRVRGRNGTGDEASRHFSTRKA